mmetsp:Transcript_15786/g.54949  ORF Transcript_15786/g.54949 Transcript_15786/m.54949 type:complete len:276 (+) Transcript_15786:1439-2266(+)
MHAHEDHELFRVDEPRTVIIHSTPHTSEVVVADDFCGYGQAGEALPNHFEELLAGEVSGSVCVASIENLVPIPTRAVPLVRGRVHRRDDPLQIHLLKFGPRLQLQSVHRLVKLHCRCLAAAIDVNDPPEGHKLDLREQPPPPDLIRRALLGVPIVVHDTQHVAGAAQKLSEVRPMGPGLFHCVDEAAPQPRLSRIDAHARRHQPLVDSKRQPRSDRAHRRLVILRRPGDLLGVVDLLRPGNASLLQRVTGEPVHVVFLAGMFPHEVHELRDSDIA